MKTINTSVVVSMAAALVLGLSACGGGGSQPNIEPVQDMMESPALKAQEFEAEAPENRGMRLPPENTVPVGFKPYKYAKDLEGAAKNPNPLKDDFSEATMVEGQKVYSIHCGVCHGQKGNGDSLTAAKMPLKPPSLINEKIRGWTDGQIYNVIEMGQGLMGPYASHIVNENDRWMVVNYIRHLQKETR